jgi:hypothetical protein
MEHDGESIETNSDSANSHGIRTRALTSACWHSPVAAALLAVGKTGSSKEVSNAERRGSARGVPPFRGETCGCGGTCLDALRARGAEPLRKTNMKSGLWAGAKRRPFASPGDRLTGQPQEREHSDAAFGGTRDRLPRARGAIDLARGIKARRAETTGSVYERSYAAGSSAPIGASDSLK